MSEQHRFTNREIADLLAGVAARLQVMDANRFRVIAYQNAAENIRNMAQDINSVAASGGLDDIPGVGPTRKKALIKAFGSVKRLREACVDEVAAVPGITRELAEEICAVVGQSGEHARSND